MHQSYLCRIYTVHVFFLTVLYIFRQFCFFFFHNACMLVLKGLLPVKKSLKAWDLRLELDDSRLGSPCRPTLTGFKTRGVGGQMFGSGITTIAQPFPTQVLKTSPLMFAKKFIYHLGPPCSATRTQVDVTLFGAAARAAKPRRSRGQWLPKAQKRKRNLCGFIMDDTNSMNNSEKNKIIVWYWYSCLTKGMPRQLDSWAWERLTTAVGCWLHLFSLGVYESAAETSTILNLGLQPQDCTYDRTDLWNRIIQNTS